MNKTVMLHLPAGPSGTSTSERGCPHGAPPTQNWLQKGAYWSDPAGFLKAAIQRSFSPHSQAAFDPGEVGFFMLASSFCDSRQNQNQKRSKSVVINVHCLSNQHLLMNGFFKETCSHVLERTSLRMLASMTCKVMQYMERENTNGH